MKVETRPLGTIKPYWRNPRKNDQAVAAVRKSIERYGFLQPIVVDPDGVIIAGHTRFRALLDMEAKEAPVVVADLDDQKAKEYRIADNATSDLSEWDMTPLIIELRELTDIGEMQAFMPTFDLDALVADVAQSMESLPTRDQIQNTEKARLEEFHEKNKRDLANYVDVVCPHCGGEFAVTRSDVMVNTTDEA